MSTVPTDAFDDLRLHAFYDSRDHLEFVEISLLGQVGLSLLGRALPLDDAVALSATVSRVLKMKPKIEEGGCSHVFAGASISLWRSCDEDVKFIALGVGRQGYFGK